MTSPPAAEELIRELGLLPHPEGGHYRETYRAARTVDNGRAAATAIYFLLRAGQVSRLHRIDADEGWHHYLGGVLEIFELDEQEPGRRAESRGSARTWPAAKCRSMWYRPVVGLARLPQPARRSSSSAAPWRPRSSSPISSSATATDYWRDFLVPPTS